jgi:hypothetical protein
VAESAAATVAVARGSAVEEEFAHARHVGERPAERHVELTAEVGDRDLLLLAPLLLEVERLT